MLLLARYLCFSFLQLLQFFGGKAVVLYNNCDVMWSQFIHSVATYSVRKPKLHNTTKPRLASLQKKICSTRHPTRAIWMVQLAQVVIKNTLGSSSKGIRNSSGLFTQCRGPSKILALIEKRVMCQKAYTVVCYYLVEMTQIQ